MTALPVIVETAQGRLNHSKRWRLAWLGVLTLLFAVPLRAADVDYVKDVKSLFAHKCTACHGPLRQEAGLRLDAGQLIHRGSDGGAVIAAGKSADSLIVEKVSAATADERMPPEGEGTPLTAEEIAKLRAWIDAGAKFPEDEVILKDPKQHWAYQVLQRPAVPEIDDEAWLGNPIDRFIAATHRERGVTPLPEADRATLLRRVSLDLIGLPPTRAELYAFLEDESPQAYERVVDRFLESPQHGERWGRHWMDVWRYSDWYGQGDWVHGSQRHTWRWRDWIIESLNADKPYDRMIVEMLAGDEVAPEDPQTLRATAFLARNYFDGNRDVWLDATVEHTFKAFLGMTLNCAKCHDHKYDPLAQTDYYRARAIFEPYSVRIDRLPGELDVKHDGIARIYDATPAAQTFLYVQGNEKNADKSRPMEALLPAFFGSELNAAPVELPLFAYAPDLREFVLTETLAAASASQRRAESELNKAAEEKRQLLQLKLAEAQAALNSTEARIVGDRARFASLPDPRREELARAAAKAEREHSVATSRVVVLERENALTVTARAVKEDDPKTKTAVEKAEKALAAARKALDEAQQALEKSDGVYKPVVEEYPRTSTGRRLALARWIASANNPLTARVAVNHVWIRHFGSALVDRAFDFGLNSPPPLHQPLLDWLAVELMDNDWRMKPLHRLIVTSRGYRLTSGEEESSTVNTTLDAENRLYWRANIRRLDAEIIRDSVLHVSGSLDQSVGGLDIDFNQGEKVPRRSVYFQHAYEKQVPFLVVFDAANPVDCYRRTESIVPQQALALANSTLSLTQARKLARSLSQEFATPGGNEDEFIVAAFEQMLTRAPWPTELAACREFLAQQRQLFKNTTSLTEFERAPPTSVDPSADPRLVRISRRHAALFDRAMSAEIEASPDPAIRARENLVHVLMNHNDFVTVR
jgi:mono/diheme cytochrome c family protein